VNGRVLASRTSATVVAGIAAVASYTHMRHLALQYGQEPLIATLLPLSVDGLVVVAAVAIGDGRKYTWSAWLSFWVGISASVVANVLAARPDPIARAISAWPAIALLLVVEVLSRSGKPSPAPVPVDDMSTTRQRANHAKPPAVTPAAQRIAKVRKDNPAAPQPVVAKQAKVSPRTVQRHWDATTPANGTPVLVSAGH
jgi:hypothetical protein